MIIIPLLVLLVRGAIKRWKTRPTQYDRYLATNEMRGLAEGHRLLTPDEWDAWKADADYEPPAETVQYPRPTRHTLKARVEHFVTRLRFGYGATYAFIHFGQEGS